MSRGQKTFTADLRIKVGKFENFNVDCDSLLQLSKKYQMETMKIVGIYDSLKCI